MRKLLTTGLFALLASSSNAGTLTAVGDSFDVDFNGIVDVGSVPTVMAGLTATATFTVTGWSYDSGMNQTTVDFDVLLDNTSNAAIWQSAVITAIGFDSNPDALSGSSSGVFTDFVVGGSFPTGAGFDVEYCASGNQNNCNGPGNTPLNVNDPNGTAQVTMVFSGILSSLELTNFGIRWQALDSTQLGISGGSGIGAEVPEPAVMALLGVGALAAGAARRRRART